MFGCSWFFNVFRGVGRNYFQMTIFDFQTDYNTFWIIFETSKNVTKYGPGPLFITKLLQTIEEMYGSALYKYYVCKSGHITF